MVCRVQRRHNIMDIHTLHTGQSDCRAVGLHLGMKITQPTTDNNSQTDTSEFYAPGEGHLVVEPTDWNKQKRMAIKLPDGVEGLPIGKCMAVGAGQVNHALAAALFNSKAYSPIRAGWAARSDPPCEPGDYVLYDAYVTKVTVDDLGRKRLFMPFANVIAVVTRPDNIGKLPLGGA